MLSVACIDYAGAYERETEPGYKSERFQEIITGRVPYCEYHNEMAVYGAIFRKELPRRPNELPENNRKTRKKWNLLVKCWNYDPPRRPDAKDIVPVVSRSYIHCDNSK